MGLSGVWSVPPSAGSRASRRRSPLSPWWAWTSGPGIGALLYATYGFRSDASNTLLAYSLSAPEQRLRGLGSAAISSGLVVLGLVFVASLARARGRSAAAIGTAAMFVSASAGVALGLSYWVHYLIEFVPAVAMATALLSRRTGLMRHGARLAVVYVLLTSLWSTTAAVTASPSTTRITNLTVERWVAAAARAQDSMLVTYGHADLVYETGLRPVYPYLWSLPLRTLDPRLVELRRLISGPSPPVWVIEWASFDTWGLDAAGHLMSDVRDHYREVRTVCGVRVFLHDGVRRSLPPAPSCLSG